MFGAAECRDLGEVLVALLRHPDADITDIDGRIDRLIATHRTVVL